jgi:hypothetical protein
MAAARPLSRASDELSRYGMVGVRPARHCSTSGPSLISLLGGFPGKAERTQARRLFFRGNLCRLMLAPRNGAFPRPLLLLERSLGTLASLFGSHANSPLSTNNRPSYV